MGSIVSLYIRMKRDPGLNEIGFLLYKMSHHLFFCNLKASQLFQFKFCHGRQERARAIQFLDKTTSAAGIESIFTVFKSWTDSHVLFPFHSFPVLIGPYIFSFRI